jgi:hypothetical protein
MPYSLVALSVDGMAYGKNQDQPVNGKNREERHIEKVHHQSSPLLGSAR